MRNIFFATSAALALIIASPLLAQETATGALGGAAVGAIVAGPPGALIGAIVGGTAGATAESARYKYDGEIHSGVVLPTSYSYRPVPEQYYVSTYKGPRTYVYAVVDDAGPNDRVVVVDPQTHAVVQILQ